MKKIAVLFTFFATMFSVNALGQKLVATDVEFLNGSTEETVEFSLSGFAETPLPAIAEFVITLPDGFSFKEGRRGFENSVKEGIAEDHAVTVFKRDNGDYYVLLSDNSGYEFYEPNGFLISLTMVKGADVADGTYKASVHDIVIDDVTGKIHLVAEKETSINIGANATVGIRDITVDAANQKVYTIGGQRVTSKNLKKGIYVVDGKKVTVK